MFEEHISGFPLPSFSDDVRELLDLCAPLSPTEGAKRLTSGNKLALFGAGEGGRAFPDVFRNMGLHVDFFVDNDPRKQGTLLCGVPVVSIDELAAISSEADLFITCGRVRDIILQLHQRGISRCLKGSLVILAADEHEPVELILRNERDIRRLFSLWEDETSTNVFYGLLNYHLTRKIDYILPITEKKHRQYFDTEIHRFGTEEFFVDVGAFDGQTTRDFIGRVENRFQKILVFEPSHGQCRQIVESFSEKADPRIRIEELALYDVETTLQFGGVTSTAKIDEFGTETVRTVPLDVFLEKQSIREKITFLKMDIEGAEVRALKGAARTIRETKPNLAICVYHRPSDLWRIPLYLHELVPEYKLYLRHYTDHPTETVCYAFIK